MIVLPFLLVFAIAYGAMEAIGIFDNNGVNAIIGLVIAIFFVQDQALAADIGVWLSSTLGTYAVFLILGVLLVLPLALSGRGPESFDIKGYPIIAIAAIGGAAIILWQHGGFQRVFGVDAPIIPGIPFQIDIYTLAIIIFVALALYWMVIRKGG